MTMLARGAPPRQPVSCVAVALCDYAWRMKKGLAV